MSDELLIDPSVWIAAFHRTEIGMVDRAHRLVKQTVNVAARRPLKDCRRAARLLRRPALLP